MVLVAIWETRDRLRAIRDGTDIGYEGGKAIGRFEAHAAWRRWFYRREYAAANGLPFDEPMPTRASIRARNPNSPPTSQP